MSLRGFPAQRRHTWLFLGLAERQAAILLDTEVEMSAVVRHRGAPGPAARAPYVAYVIDAVAAALGSHPEANAAARGRLWPRLRRYEQVVAKVAFDRQVDGVRAVVSGLVPNADRAGLVEIAERVAYFKDCDPASAPELAGTRALWKLPWPLALLAFKLATASLRRRPELLGTFAVSSLGHRAVESFYPLGGTATSFGVGRVADRAIVRDGELVAAPTLRLGLVFDHRVLDGAAAADLLDDVKQRLEAWPAAGEGQPG